MVLKEQQEYESVYGQKAEDHKDLEVSLSNQPKSAFVVFRSMEGQARAVDAFKRTFWDKCLNVCSCGRNAKVGSRFERDKRFKGQWLTVKRAVDPELVIWENYGINLLSRIIRTCIFWLFFIGILSFCFWSVVNLENRNQLLDKAQPKVDCKKINVTESLAIQDYQKKSNET